MHMHHTQVPYTFVSTCDLLMFWKTNYVYMTLDLQERRWGRALSLVWCNPFLISAYNCFHKYFSGQNYAFWRVKIMLSSDPWTHKTLQFGPVFPPLRLEFGSWIPHPHSHFKPKLMACFQCPSSGHSISPNPQCPNTSLPNWERRTEGMVPGFPSSRGIPAGRPWPLLPHLVPHLRKVLKRQS